MKILVIEDDGVLTRLLIAQLTHIGYEVVTAACGQEGLRLAYQQNPDLVVLDVMMPGMDGWETCRRLRELSDVPIIMLTAKGEEEDVIHGLELGADDYLRKPCSLHELELRIGAVLRRVKARPDQADGVFYNDGYLMVDLERRVVMCDCRSVHLTPTEFNLLSFLLHNANRVSSHGEIIAAVWGPEYVNDTAILPVYIRYLREKLEEDPARPRYIHNERGVGYRFTGNSALT
jgi:two-component system KDP operon response regulator KdpE